MINPIKNKPALIIVLSTITLITILNVLELLSTNKYDIPLNCIYITTIILYFIIVLAIFIIKIKKVISLPISLAVFVSLIFLLYYTIKQPNLIITKNKLQIISIFSTDINLSEIDTMWLSEENFEVIEKINGVDLANYYRGNFFIKNSRDTTKIFVNRLTKPYIYIQQKNKSIIIYNNISRKKTNSDFEYISGLLNKKK